MTVQKLSVALDEEVAEAARAAAEEAGISLSAWLTETARNRLRIADGLAAIREYEEEFGPFTAAERAEARARVDEALGPRSDGDSSSAA